MFLVLLACGSAVLAGSQIGVLGIGLCFGLVLVCLCYAIGGISGCHVNPAVSFAIYLTDDNFKAKDLFGYVVAQLLGAAVGAAFPILVYAVCRLRRDRLCLWRHNRADWR